MRLNFPLIRRLVAIFVILILCTDLFSKSIPKDTAQKAANNFFKYKTILANGLTIKSSYVSLKDSIPTYYVFNFEGGGWVIIAADDVATPILAYSIEGYADESNINPSARLWLDDISGQIRSAAKDNVQNKSSAAEWEDALNNNFKVNNIYVDPLLKCRWNQTQFYNDSCPADPDSPYGYNGHVPTGCVATAMAQVMKYYEYPPKGNGSNSYLSNYGYLSANFGNTNYNWAAMPDSLLRPNKEVAQLIYHCGVSIDMDYGPTGSGAYSESVPPALINYFGYNDSVFISYIPTDTIGIELWISQIKLEMDNKRPVIYTGYSSSSEGHCFVCDGYDNSFPTKFHFNWGWGGDYDGYFAIRALNQVPNDSLTYWNYYNSIITQIKPLTNTSQIECELTDPVDQSVINSDSSIIVNVNILNGKPKIINLFIDNILKDSVINAPYTFSYPAKNLASGRHNLKIIASNNQMSCTDSVVFYVFNNLTSGCWKLQHIIPSDEGLSISYLSIVDSLVVWATLGGSDNLFTTTSDGGLNWHSGYISNPAISSLSLSNIFGIDSQRAYACFNPGNGTGGAILFTSDGGITWANQPSADFSNSWADWVYFFDADNGICMGDSYENQFVVYTTNNGGNQWNRVLANNIPPAKNNEAGLENSYDAYNNSIWFGTGDGRLYKSFDKGLTWSVQDSIFSSLITTYYVKFKDSLNVFAHIGEGLSSQAVYKTQNAGKTWTKYIENNPMTNLIFIPGTKSTWIDFRGYTQLSTDDDSTFNIIDESINMNEIRFKSAAIGWGGSYYSDNLNGAGIYKWIGSFSPIITYNVTFHVVDQNNNVLPNVNIDNGFIYISDNSSGDAVFNISKAGNPYTFTFSKYRYETFEDKYNIQSDTTIKIILDTIIINTGSVTFRVNNLLNSPVEGISIYFNDSLKYTDIKGKAQFSNLDSAETYIYSVLKGDEYVDYGNVTVNAKENFVNITFLLDSFYQFKKIPDLIFPNPATNLICIISDSTITSVKLFNLAGEKVFEEQTNSNIVQVPVQNLANGLYFLQVYKKPENVTYKVMIRH